MLAAQCDFSLAGIDAQDLDVDVITELNNLLRVLDIVLGQLGDVEKPFQARFQLHEDPKIGEFRDLALLDVAGLVAAGDVTRPGVGGHLLEAKGDAPTLGVHVQDDAANFVALVNYLAQRG